MNECLNRAHVVDNIKYVALVDLDEVLMVYNYNRLLDFLMDNDEEGYHSFMFRNVFFFGSYTRDYTTVPRNSRKRFLLLRSL